MTFETVILEEEFALDQIPQTQLLIISVEIEHPSGWITGNGQHKRGV